MSESGRWPLPSTWRWVQVGEVAKVVGGGTPSNAKDDANYASGGVPWITPADLSGYKGTYISRGTRDLSQQGFKSCSARMLPAGSVLLSSRAPVGYCAIAANEISTNQGFKSLVLDSSNLLPEFVRHYLIGAKRYLESQASGTTFLELSGARTEQLLLPIAPLAEQQRIVSRIEELFSEIDQGERALERVGRLVERYRQSVLKAAVTGELTREWREGRDLQKWSSAPIHELGTVITGNTPPTNEPDNYGEGLPFLKPTDLDQGYVLTEFRQALTARGQQYCRPLKANAVLVTCIGATIGKMGLARLPCATNQQINAVEVDAARVRAKFLFWCLASPQGQRAIIGGASATTLPILNKSRFQSIEVPLPTLDEQDVMVSLIEQHMDQAARAVKTVAIEARRLGALRQSILKAAFSGQLVPQDPRDEPASALLTRLAAQPADAPATPRRRGRPAGRRLSQPNPDAAE